MPSLFYWRPLPAMVLMMLLSWLADAWKDYLSPGLAWVWGGPFWQPLTLVLLTAGIAAYTLRHWLARRILTHADNDRSHDVALFRKLDKTASESFVGQVLNDELYILSAPMEPVYNLWDFIRQLEQVGNRYLDRKVRKRAEKLVGALRALRSIVGLTFWKVEKGWIKFYPDRIDSEVYEREHAELNAQIDNAWAAYKGYRVAVKDRLRI